MIDLGPRIYGLGRTGSQDLDCRTFRPKGKRKLYEDAELLDNIGDFKRLRHVNPTLDSATTYEIVVVDENWQQCANTISIPEETTDIINLDDLGPLNGTSSLHNDILRDAHLIPHEVQRVQVSNTNPTQPPLQPSDPDIGDLEWLINFKVDSVFEPRRQDRHRHNKRTNLDANANSASDSVDVYPKICVGASTIPSSSVSSCSSASSTSSRCSSSEQTTSAASTTSRCKPPTGTGRYAGPGKPPFTYTELIELALKDKGRLTVKEIYQWITKHFPFYKAVDERWKNSVRHNLSINPHFRKASKAPQGAGHLWVVVDNHGKTKNTWKEERIQNFLAMTQSTDVESEAATASITVPVDEDPLVELGVKMESASASPIIQRPQPPSPPPSPERVSLERSAEEILSGIKRQVGVEFVPPVDLEGNAEAVEANASAFFYPELSKEQLIAESGLYDELAGLCFINDMLSSNDQASENLFSDDLGLSYELSLTG